MAATKYTLSNVNGYTTPVGNRALAVRNLSWDSGNYVNPTGVAIGKNSFGMRGIDTAWGGISKGGNYYVEAQLLSGAGSGAVTFRLFVLSTGVEVANGVALTADSVTVGVIGG